jgi:hypothetical protein
LHKKSDFPPEAAFFMQNTEGSKAHKRLIINPIIKRLSVKKGKNTEGGLHYKHDIFNLLKNKYFVLK